MNELDFRWDITSEEVYADSEARDYYAANPPEVDPLAVLDIFEGYDHLGSDTDQDSEEDAGE